MCLHAPPKSVVTEAGTLIITDDYRELIGKTVCDVNSLDCTLHHCDNCPGDQPLQEYLSAIFAESDPEAIIEFKQWMQIDRANLISQQLFVEEFIMDVSAKVTNLSVHQYIVKHQASYLKDLKEKHQPEELVCLMDFAENYSFVIQDEIQGFHWKNSQTTLHPFAVYRKQYGEVQCLSMSIISDCLQHNADSFRV